ncbi:MAG: hypothetical protein ACSLFQ_21585 [Thermoanaerobaculia bacterium]
MVGLEERSVVARVGGGVSGAREAIFAILSLVVFTHLLYGAILPFAFTHDDPVIFMHTASRTPWELVASPKAWRDYNALNFFPEQLWSFKLDLTLFGLEPFALRERQLLGLTLAAFLLYAVIRGFAGPVASGWGAVVFLAGPTCASLAEQLMARHYVDGLAFALAAYLALRRSFASERPRAWLAAACGLYLLAVLAKEVFAPLPFVAFVVHGGLRRNLRAWLGLGAMLGVAVVYRMYMVGALARVYRPDIWTTTALVDNGRRLARAIPEVLFSLPLAYSIAALLLFVFAASIGMRSVRHAVVAIAAAASVAGPAVLVAENLDARHLLPLWALISIGAAWGLSAMTLRTGRVAAHAAAALLALLLFAGTLEGNRARWSNCLHEARAFSATWDFVFRDGRQGDVLQLPDGVVRGFGYSYAAASWLRIHFGDGSPGPLVAGVEDVAFCLVELPQPLRLFRERDGKIVEDPEFAASLPALCAASRRTGGLQAKVSYRQSQIVWELDGASGSGTHFILVRQVHPELETFAQTYAFPPRGALWMPPERGELRVAFLFRSNQGWFTATSPQTIPLREGAVVGLLPAAP